MLLFPRPRKGSRRGVVIYDYLRTCERVAKGPSWLRICSCPMFAKAKTNLSRKQREIDCLVKAARKRNLSCRDSPANFSVGCCVQVLETLSLKPPRANTNQSCEVSAHAEGRPREGPAGSSALVKSIRARPDSPNCLVKGVPV